MEVSQMKKGLLLVIGLVFSPVVLFSQGKPVIVVHAFSTASGVSWPYDVKQLQAQTVAELKACSAKISISSQKTRPVRRQRSIRLIPRSQAGTPGMPQRVLSSALALAANLPI